MIDADFYDILANIGDASILDLYTNCRAIVTERNKVNVESGLLETEKKIFKYRSTSAERY